jgi:TRAP transporter TAXI family solute receptor
MVSFARTLLAILLCGAGALGVVAHAAPDYKIATDNERGTSFAIGNDLARLVAPGAGIRLTPLQTAGSAANIRLLRYDAQVKFAVVQADVYQAFLEQSRAGNAEAQDVMRASRIVMPLFDTEIHYIVRADSPMNFVHDTKAARINGGVVGSGAALATHAIHRALFNAPLAEEQSSHLPPDEALVKLITDKSVDVVVIASGQPAPLIANMKPEAQKFIKLLKFDTSHPSAAAVLKHYKSATVLRSSYPNLINADFATPAVGSHLITYDYEQRETVDALTRFARSLCRNFSELKSKGHAKWKTTDLALPVLPNGWSYYPPTADEIKACLAKDGKPAIRSEQACTAEQKLLGLCS